jgi:hypothetical protein
LDLATESPNDLGLTSKRGSHRESANPAEDRLLRQAASRLLEAALVKQAFDRLDVTLAYGIGIVAAYWLIERTTAFFA